MADWYANTTWSPEIEAEFFRRFARARRKRVILTLQCLRLLAVDAKQFAPIVLRLLERYPSERDPVPRDIAERYAGYSERFDRDRMDLLQVRALARRWTGDPDGAVADHREMTSHLRAQGQLGSRLEDIDFARLVLEEELTVLDEEAYALLQETGLDSPFPKSRFARALARARLAHRLGRTSEASAHAQDALRETTFTRTQMRNHPHLGLVQSPDPGVLDELHWLADPSSRH